MNCKTNTNAAPIIPLERTADLQSSQAVVRIHEDVDEAVDPPAEPRIGAVRPEPGGIVVQWTVSPASPASASPTRPFIVVGLTEVAGHVRFEKVGQ